jgi:hypothetical protein
MPGQLVERRVAEVVEPGAREGAPEADRPRASWLLERALLLTFVVHGLAMLAMASLLLPGMPGGGASDDAARIAYIAAHPWWWRLGWLPWQLTALSDLFLACALMRTCWVPRLPAALTLLVTVAAIIPDQLGQVAWVTRGIALAQAGDSARYLAFEARIFAWTAAWGGLLYTLGALGWTWSFVATRTWRPWLTPFSILLWGLFALVNAGPLLPIGLRPAQVLLSAGNAVSFVLLEVWFVAVTELVLRRARPEQPHGRYAPWRYPRPVARRVLDPLANSRFVRALAEYLPILAFRSDISDVIYVNYVVEAARLQPLVPEGLVLQRLGPDGVYAFFTFLSYRHGHFGPALLGPLRRFLPSPVQTNWRIHVRDPRTGTTGIYFVTNAIDSTIHALAARMLSEGMPMHVLRSGIVGADGKGGYRLSLEPGAGSAPDAVATLCAAGEMPDDGPWRACFASYEAMLAYCVPQDRALSSQPWYRRTTRQEIDLGIPLSACEPLVGEVHSRAARAIVGDAIPFCFRVASVDFLFAREEHDPLA